MFRQLFFLLIVFCNLSFAFDHSHRQWSEVLAKYEIADGLVKYRDLKADLTANPQHPLATYLNEIASVSKTEFDAFSKNQKMAFLINAYNALTFKLVTNHYPVKSIKDIGSLFQSPWKKEFFSLLEGQIKTLDPIEHDYLRKRFPDARVHAAINSASLSGPKLQPVAFTPDKLNEQLNHAVKAWLSDSSRNQFDRATRTMKLSKVFDWYEKDFVEGYGSVTAFIEKFGPSAARDISAREAKIKFLTYDWKLNEAVASTN